MMVRGSIRTSASGSSSPAAEAYRRPVTITVGLGLASRSSAALPAALAATSRPGARRPGRPSPFAFPLAEPGTARSLQLGQPALQESPLVLGAHEVERTPVCKPRLVRAAQPAQEVTAGRVQVVVGVELELLHRVKAGLQALRFGDCDGAIERDHRGARQPYELAVQRRDLRPVGAV